MSNIPDSAQPSASEGAGVRESVAKDGRVMVKTPAGWRARSRVVMEAQLGRALSADEEVHHINRDASDDRPENLQVVSRAEHRRLDHLGPTGREPTPKRKRKLPKTLTPEEVAALFAACNLRAPTGLRDRCMMELMYRAGLRVGEVRRLMPRDVDTARGELRIFDSKGGDGTAYFDTERCSALLEEWKRVRRRLGVPRGAPLFCTLKGTIVLERQVQHMMKRRAVRAGIDPSKVTPHRLRHTFATELLDEGRFTIYDVKELLRHADLSSTEVYLHVRDSQLRAKIQRRQN